MAPPSNLESSFSSMAYYHDLKANSAAGLHKQFLLSLSAQSNSEKNDCRPLY